MIEKIDTSHIQNLLEKSTSRQPGSAGALPNNDADVSLQLNYASLIDKATQLPQADTNTIRKAQELLSSGQLEDPDNIRAAAENILTFGI